jgi:glycosyltransferase involved in cell wall biosynthesis
MATITVNIVSFRYGHLAATALESVLSQTRKPDVVRVIDDGVGDCGFLLGLYPDVEFVMNPVNLGLVQNFNSILNSTRTDKCLMLGADNFLRPDALEKMESAGSDIASSDMAYFGETSRSYGERTGSVEKWHGFGLHAFRGGDIEVCNYIHGSSLFDVAKAKAAGGYSPSGRHENYSEEDWVLWKRMMRAGAQHTHVPEPLLFYRRHRHNFQK